MVINRDTEPREDAGEGLVSDLDDETKKAAFSILSEATGGTSPIDTMSIAPLDSSYDESVGFCTLGINCTTEGGPNFALSSKMPNDWTFDEDTAVLITSQRRKGDDVIAARVHRDYSTHVRVMVEKHNKYGQRMKGRDD
eukprot:13586586-Ditylum_brightwellii.AAC.1